MGGDEIERFLEDLCSFGSIFLNIPVFWKSLTSVTFKGIAICPLSKR